MGYFLLRPVLILVFGLATICARAGDLLPGRHIASNEYTIERNGSAAMVKIGEKVICIIRPIDDYYWTNTPVRFSTDGKAVIFSPTQYVFISDFDACNGSVKKPRLIKNHDGVLIDINVKTLTYLSIDITAERPLLYIASIGRLDGRSLGFHPRGVRNGSLKLDQRWGFGDVNMLNPKGKILIDGRYISAADIPDCSVHAHPGVWDLLKKRKVRFTADTQSEIDKKCDALFVTP